MVTELNISEEIISYSYDYFPTKRILYYYYKANSLANTLRGKFAVFGLRLMLEA